MMGPRLSILITITLTSIGPIWNVHGTHTTNVLFIAVDDLNDWVNCMGGRKGIHTLNLGRLAARGVLFINAHGAAPSCNPSRDRTE